jgi:hypothetical protein
MSPRAFENLTLGGVPITISESPEGFYVGFGRCLNQSPEPRRENKLGAICVIPATTEAIFRAPNLDTTTVFRLLFGFNYVVDFLYQTTVGSSVELKLSPYMAID